MDRMESKTRGKINTRTVIFAAACLLWLAFIFARSLKSADESTMESAWVLELVRKLIPSVSMHFVRKLAHFTEFFILGCLIFTAVRRILPSSAVCLAAAVADELLQSSVPGRSCQISDMLLDFCGSLAGILILFLIMRRYARH